MRARSSGSPFVPPSEMARSPTLLDLLCAQYPGRQREALLSLVLCGEILVDGSVIRDPKLSVSAQAVISIEPKRFVSRGGAKLDHALERFRVDVSGLVCLDAGASTGGFTDCLLQRGAAHVHAVDVGKNQLAYSLRVDSRVQVYERTSVLALSSLEPPPSFAVADLSFRSLAGAAAHVLGLTTLGQAIVLIKPQFEWQDPPPEFSGTVPAERAPAIVAAVVATLGKEGVIVQDICESPITGREGNREFLAWIRHESAGETAYLSPAQVLERLRTTS